MPISKHDWSDAAELRNHALELAATWRITGPSSAYPAMAAQRLPEDFDLALLEPHLPAGVQLPAYPVPDPRYQGFAMIRDC